MPKKSTRKSSPAAWEENKKGKEYFDAFVELVISHQELLSTLPQMGTVEWLQRATRAAAEEDNRPAYSMILEIWLLANKCSLLPGVYMHDLFGRRRGAPPKPKTLLAALAYLENPDWTDWQIAQKLEPKKFGKENKKTADLVRNRINRGLEWLGRRRPNRETTDS